MNSDGKRPVPRAWTLERIQNKGGKTFEED